MGVDRPAADGDFVSLDMIATIEDEEIESVEGVSYQIGEGNMLEGLDEALIGLSAEETTTFESQLAGGDRAGETAQVKVARSRCASCPRPTTSSPRMVAEFDTIAELKEDLKTQAAADAEGNRVALARNALLEKLLEELECPSPSSWWRTRSPPTSTWGEEAGDPRGDAEDTEKAVRAQFLLDEINGTREVQVDQNDLMSYMSSWLSTASSPTSCCRCWPGPGGFEQIFSEVQRSKALDIVLRTSP